MEALDKLTDMSWDILDRIGLGETFDKYNIPPLVFPIAIILVILLLAWMLMAGPGGPAAECGDFACVPGEDCQSCPQDCVCPSGSACDPSDPQADDMGCVAGAEPGGITVVVQLGGPTVTQEVTVQLYDSNDNLIQSQSGKKSTFQFHGIEPKVLKAVADCPSGAKSDSRPRVISESNPMIALTLPDECFDGVIRDQCQVDSECGIGYECQNQRCVIVIDVYGSVEVEVLDAATFDPLDDATVTLLRSFDDQSEKSLLTAGGLVTMNVPADRYYYVNAFADGYTAYSGRAEPFYLGSGVTKDISIELDSLVPPVAPGDPVPTGEVTVCVEDDDGDPLEDGEVTIYDAAQDLAEIDEDDLGDDGCVTFTGITEGSLVRAALTDAPPGCIEVAADASDEVTISGNETETIELETICGGTAFVKVKVKDVTGASVTDDTTVTIEVEDTGDIIGPLEYDTAGFTEEAEIPAGMDIKARAAVSSALLGYVDSESASMSYTPGEHGVIEIILTQQAIAGEFTFLGASVFYTPATPGSPVKIFVNRILYEDIELTGENAEVEVIITSDGDEVSYPAEYVE